MQVSEEVEFEIFQFLFQSSLAGLVQRSEYLVR